MIHFVLHDMSERKEGESGRIWAQRAFGGLVLVFISILLQILSLVVMPEPQGPFGLSTMVEGRAGAPFAYRALMPLTVNGLERSLTPVRNKTVGIWGTSWTQEANITNNRMRSILVHAGATSESDALHIVFWSIASVMCFSVFGMFLWRYFVSVGFSEMAGCTSAGGLMVLIVPILLRPPLQMYDPMTLALGAALAFFGLRKEWLPFFLILPFTCAAKEALLILCMLPILDGISTRNWRLVISAIVAALASYWIAKSLVVDTAGLLRGAPKFQFTFQENLELLRGKNVASFFMSILALVPICSVIATGWRKAEAISRQRLLVTTGVMFLPLVFFARFVEPRIFYELIPLALMVAAPHSWLVGSQATE